MNKIKMSLMDRLFGCSHEYTTPFNGGEFIFCQKCGLLVVQSCKHKWTTIKEVNVYGSDGAQALPTACKYILRCERCGDIKVVRDGN